MADPAANPFAKFAPPAEADNPFSKYMGRPDTATASATPKTGEQPSFMDRVVASPVGRAAQNLIVDPLFNASSLLLAGGAHQPLQDMEDNAYKGAIQRNQNTPGYAAALDLADKVMDARGGSGFKDQVTAGINPAVAGLTGLMGGLDESNAMADVQTAAQDKYAHEHPIISTGATLLGGLMAGPEGALKDLPEMASHNIIPSIGDLKSAAQGAYKAVHDSGMEIAQPAMQSLADTIKARLADMGFNDDTIAELAPKTSTAVRSLEKAASSPQTLQGLEMQRRIAGHAAGAVDKTDRTAARVVQDSIDDFVDSMGPEHVTGDFDQPAIDSLNNARDLWKRSAKAQQIQDTIDKASNTAGGDSSFSPTYETALRTKFRVLSSNPRAMARFSQDEQDAIRNVATGGSMMSVRNLLQTVGKLSPQSVIPLIAETSAMAAEPTMAAVPAAGFAARVGATKLTKAAAGDAVKTAVLGEALKPAESMLHMPAITKDSRVPLGLGIPAGQDVLQDRQ